MSFQSPNILTESIVLLHSGTTLIQDCTKRPLIALPKTCADQNFPYSKFLHYKLGLPVHSLHCTPKCSPFEASSQRCHSVNIRVRISLWQKESSSALMASTFISPLKLTRKMVWFLLLLPLISSIVTGQEFVGFLPLYDSNPETLQDSSHNGIPVAIHVENHYLKNVSNSVLMAESWLRTHVLSHYPATNITSILVGHNLLCRNDQEDKLVLPAIKNVHYSLTRWGLQNDIKVSSTFSSNCLDFKSETYRVDLAENYIKPLLNTLQEISSPYFVNPPSSLHPSSDETMSFLKCHSKSMKNLGVRVNKISVIISSSTRNVKPTSRKLSFIDYSSLMGSFPARPTQISPSPAPGGSSEPAFAAGSPLPPLIGKVSPPPITHPIAPALPPMVNPHTPPFGPHLPPCNPSGDAGSVAAPVGSGVHNGLWCVAKPSVPPETLQEALDYACGKGGADCEAIRPNGRCYFPDTVVAHASYAFNIYWQKNKKNGGSCGFGGTAMLISSDPSYNHCRFVLL